MSAEDLLVLMVGGTLVLLGLGLGLFFAYRLLEAIQKP